VKKTFLIGVLAVLVLTVGGIRHIIRLNGDSWRMSRRLSEALVDARAVTLIEHVKGKIIAQKIATPDEIARLQNATRTGLRPFKPNMAQDFNPHHRIEIRRANDSIETLDICFHCEAFSFLVNDNDDKYMYDPAALPPSLDKSLTVFFTSVGMRPRTWEEYSEIQSSVDLLMRRQPPP
jgi:hypothetical protein